MKIAVAADHGGFGLKTQLAQYLGELGHEVLDVGAHTADRTDYPIWGSRAAHAVADGEADLAVICCGSGIGISIAANKVPGARCVVCTEPYSAQMGRRHNNANMLALGERFVGPDMARAIVDAFLDTGFDGGRHEGRVALLDQLDAGERL